jgi:hypothetical protein
MKHPAWFIIMILVSAVVVLTVMLVAKPTRPSYTKSDMIASLEADGYWVLAGGSHEVPGDHCFRLGEHYA